MADLADARGLEHCSCQIGSRDSTPLCGAISYGEKLQTFEEAILETFKREWISEEKNLRLNFYTNIIIKRKTKKRLF